MGRTAHAGLAERARELGNYGQRRPGEHVRKGGSSRLDALQAAGLEVKLRHLGERNAVRAALPAHLATHGVATGVHYPRPLHLLPACADLGHGPGAFPVTERASREVLSLPMFPELTTAQIGRVADAVASFPQGPGRGPAC